MFQRIDKEGKGYIDLKDLESLMKDEKKYFGGKDASLIMEKYGTDGKMRIEHFITWWNSTYTSYNDDALAQIVVDAQADNDQVQQNPERLEVAPWSSNVAVSRS